MFESYLSSVWIVTVCKPAVSQIRVKVLSRKLTRAAPGVGLLAVTVTSLTLPSTSVRISFRKMTF